MAKVLKELALKYAWKELFLSEHGPKNPCTVLVLMMLAEHMKPDGSDCWPSQAYLTKRTRLSERTVRCHVAFAVTAGWLSVSPKKRVKGRSWFVNEYRPLIPEAAKATVWRQPGIKVPGWLQKANGADNHPARHAGSSEVDEAAPHAGSSTPLKDAQITRHHVPDQVAAGAGIIRHQVPTNLSREPINNITGTDSPGNGVAGGVFLKVKKGQKPEPESDAEKRKRIVTAMAMCPEDESPSPETLGRLTRLSPDDIRRLN